MPDPTPTPTPQPDPKKKRAPKGPINKKHLDDVSRTEKTIATAQKDAYAAKLADREIDDAFLTGLSTDCGTARGFISQAGDKTTDKLDATDAESKEKAALLAAVREVQAAAKQKYDGDKPKLKDYHVGERIEQKRSVLEQAAEDILNKLKTDTLPGIKPPKVQALKDALAAYKGADTTQSGEQSAATGARTSLDDVMDKINKGRRKILFAADAEWSSTKAANAAIRTEFGLPPNRPYSG
jgi:hypothetical protein